MEGREKIKFENLPRQMFRDHCRKAAYGHLIQRRGTAIAVEEFKKEIPQSKIGSEEPIFASPL